MSGGARPQSTVRWIVRARCTASAVPQEPAPITAIVDRDAASTPASFEVVTQLPLFEPSGRTQL